METNVGWRNRVEYRRSDADLPRMRTLPLSRRREELPEKKPSLRNRCRHANGTPML